jgi:GNAT superfamily N-acetyltransferase
MEEKDLQIRLATRKDAEDLLQLINELALYEKAPDEVINTADQLIKDGFEDQPLYTAFVAEYADEVIGMALTYYRYSTWKGKCLYLEDLYVKPDFRGIGAGKQLFNQCIAFGKSNNCVRLNWQVLDWNTPAIEFYKRFNADLDGEWINGSLDL